MNPRTRHGKANVGGDELKSRTAQYAAPFLSARDLYWMNANRSVELVGVFW